jgi:hypothetical protein
MTSFTTVSTVIAAGQSLSLSDPVDCAGCNRIARIAMPSAWTGGAQLTFQLSEDGTGFRDLYCMDPKTLYPFEASFPRPMPGSVSTLPAGTGLGAMVSFLRVRSGMAALPVTQSPTEPSASCLKCRSDRRHIATLAAAAEPPAGPRAALPRPDDSTHSKPESAGRREFARGR